MALKLQIKSKGVDAEYWKITEVLSDILNDKTRVRLSLYVSEYTRSQDVNNILEEKIFWFEHDGYSLTNLYSMIKDYEEETQINENGFPKVVKIKTFAEAINV